MPFFVPALRYPCEAKGQAEKVRGRRCGGQLRQDDRGPGVRENPVAGRMRGNDRVEVSPGPPQRNGASPHEHPNHAGTATTDTAEEITALALSVDNIIKVPSSEGDSSAFVELSANAAGCCFFLYPGLLALLAIQTIWRPWELQPKVHQWRKVAKGAE